MKKNCITLTLFFSMAFIVSCKKNYTLPTASQESNQVEFNQPGISARVNESGFSSSNNNDTTQPALFYATYGSDSTSLIILGDGKLNNQDTVNWAQILLWVVGFNGEGTYSIDNGSSLGVFSVVDTSNNLRQFVSSGSPNGGVTITEFDSVNKTISGTFEFSALSNDSLITVKSGVFNSVKIN